MVPGAFLLPAGLLITGWTARAEVHWIAPDIGIALVGAGTILNFQSIQTYIIDTFTLHAASGMFSPHASAVVRTLIEAPCSSCCSDLLPLTRRLRFPAVRACHVQGARLRQGRYDPCVLRYCCWCPRVSQFSPFQSSSYALTQRRVGHSSSGHTASGSETPASTQGKGA